MLDAAKRLFPEDGRYRLGQAGRRLLYTLTWDDRPDQPDRYWWPCAEGIGAAAMLGAVDSDPAFESWYRRIWGFVDNHVIDRRFGGWIPELDSNLAQVNRVFVGKPDLYHALQACIIPLLPRTGVSPRA